MKRFLQVLLCACLTVGVAVGCGIEQAETEEKKTNGVKTYPEYIDAFVDTSDIFELPEIAYVTPASENGLQGKVYKIFGEVTEGGRGESDDSFTVKTDTGEVYILDSGFLVSVYLDGLEQKYFAVPKVGEEVCVYVEYWGYSDDVQASECFYGGQDYADRVIAANKNTDQKAALDKAKTYNDELYLSKRGIYKFLTSAGGGNFSEDAAQYAVDNLQADYKANALKQAENYQYALDMSPASIYEHLISEYGEQFTAEEAQYAVDNLK